MPQRRPTGFHERPFRDFLFGISVSVSDFVLRISCLTTVPWNPRPPHHPRRSPSRLKPRPRPPPRRGTPRSRAYQWLVLVIASAGWVFDAFEGQLYNLTRQDLLRRAAGRG